MTGSGGNRSLRHRVFDDGQIAFAKFKLDAPADIRWKTSFGIIRRIELDAPSRAALYHIDFVALAVWIERLSPKAFLCVGNSDLLRSRCRLGAAYERQRYGKDVKLPHSPWYHGKPKDRYWALADRLLLALAYKWRAASMR